MIAVSSAWRREQEKKIASPMRASVAFVAGDAGSADAAGDNGHMAWSRLDALSLPQVPADGAYATLEPGRTKADGRLRALPDSEEDYANEGFVSRAMSDGEGLFETPPALWFRFASPVTAPGVTLVFDEAAGEWPQAVMLTAWDEEGAVLAQKELSPAAAQLYVPGPFAGLARMALTFTRCAPRRRARLARASFGAAVTLTGAQLSGVEQVLEVDPIGRRLPEGRLAFTVVNENAFRPDGGGPLYDPEDPQGLWGYLDARNPVRLSWGQEMAGGIGWSEAAAGSWGDLYADSWGGVYGRSGVQWLDGGQYYLTGKPKVDGMTVRFEAQDLLACLDGTFEKGVYAPAERSLYELALDVLQDEGLPQVLRLAKPWRLWDGLREMRTTAPLPRRSHRECLQLIAHAARCCLFTDRAGNICIRPAPDGDTGWAVGPGQMLEKPAAEKTAPAGAVRCAVYRYRPESGETLLYEGQAAVAGTAQVHITYDASMAQRAAVTGAGVALDEEASRFYAHGADLALTGTGTAHIAVTGHALAADAGWVTAAGDAGGETAEFDNPLLTDPQAARAAAEWALGHLRLRSTYAFDTRGAPEAEPLDVFRLQTSFGDGPARVLRCETQYSGGLRTRLTAKRLAAEEE